MIDSVAVSRHIRTVSCMRFEGCEIQHTAGRSVNHGYVVTDGKKRFFVKTNRADLYNMFEKEARSLSAPTAISRWV